MTTDVVDLGAARAQRKRSTRVPAVVPDPQDRSPALPTPRLSVQKLYEELGDVYALGAQRGRQASVLARSISKALDAPAECVDRVWSAVRLYQVGAIIDDTRVYEKLPFHEQIHLSALTLAEFGHTKLVRYLAAASFTEPTSIRRLDLDFQIAHAVVNLTHHDDGNVPILVRIKSLRHHGYIDPIVAVFERELEAKSRGRAATR